MRLLSTLLVLATTHAAHAELGPPSETPVLVVEKAPAAFDPSATISIEPIFLMVGIVEANVELRVAPHVGLQAIGGYGGIMFTTIKELGGEANVYARPQLAGFHVGAMARYLWGSQSFLFSAAAMSNGDSGDVLERELGAYVGWKWIGWRNLTAVVQLGVGKYDVDGKDAVHQVAPIANLTAGYSF